MDQNCDVIWAFDMDSKKIVTFADTFQWEDWFKEKQNIKNQNLNKKNAQVSAPEKNSNKKGLTQKEKHELSQMESVIAVEESKLAQLQKELLLPDTQNKFSKLAELSTEIARLENKIEKLFSRWEELNSK
jgi:ATP-binding cassette subfamily F protein uup